MHDWPETDDGWNALSREQILALYGGATSRLLVDVSDSNFLKCVPSLDYVLHDLDGEEVFNTFIELHVIEFYYSCICSRRGRRSCRRRRRRPRLRGEQVAHEALARSHSRRRRREATPASRVR